MASHYHRSQHQHLSGTDQSISLSYPASCEGGGASCHVSEYLFKNQKWKLELNLHSHLYQTLCTSVSMQTSAVQKCMSDVCRTTADKETIIPPPPPST